MQWDSGSSSSSNSNNSSNGNSLKRSRPEHSDPPQPQPQRKRSANGVAVLAPMTTTMLTLQPQPMPEIVNPPTSRSSVTEPDNASNKYKPMCREINRLDSFINWPHSDFLPPTRLAKAGFFYTQADDLVKCPFCDIELGRWNPGEDPLEDHRKYSQNCPFLVNPHGCGNIAAGPEEAHRSPALAPEFSYDTCGKYGINVRSNSVPEDVSAEANGTRPPPFNLNRYAIRKTDAVYPEYAVLEVRLKSFDEWPVSLRQKPEELAAAGFYYTGKGDQTLCFSCGGGLKSWEETDVPWEQHAKWFRNCQFLRLNKSQEYINRYADNNKEMATVKEEEEAAGASSLSGKSSGGNNDAAEEEVLAESGATRNKRSSTKSSAPAKDDDGNGNNDASTATLCKVCFTKEVGVVFLPCGHMFSCVDCAPALKNCGVCRCKLEATVRAFLS